MIFTLQPGIGVPLPAHLLSVRLQVIGGTGLPELDALALRGEEAEHPVGDIVRHPGLLVFAVREPVVIRIRPPAPSATFPAGSVFGLVLGPEGADADRATLRSVDASGLRSCDLVTLTPAGDDVVVTAVAQSAQVMLPPLAARARIAARELLGAPSVPASESVAVRLVIDSSASLRPSLASGLAAAAVDIVSGIATLISSLPHLPAAACGQRLVALADHRFEDPAAITVAEVVALAPSIGFRSRLVPDGGERGLTYVITDGPPADLSPERRDLLHLVLIGCSEPAEAGCGAGGQVWRTGLASDAEGRPEELQVVPIVGSLLAGYCRSLRGSLP